MMAGRDLADIAAGRAGRRGVPAREGEQRRDEPRCEDQGFIVGHADVAHTQAALHAQLEAQERADVWWSSLLRTWFEDGAVERGVLAGGRDGAVPGGEEGFSEEARCSFSNAGEEEGDFSVTVASCGIGQWSVSIGSRIVRGFSRESSVDQPQQQQQ
ncbi:hypothetical protein Taro_000519 [Colocasia esculenta]|uniref:Uncharacterized protein n=1 Tax=Colocasia esculenta TaxID=4460 RepID=A0A843TGQ2_COLES|nr:hypothetical protein [Colocasia esculenta]